MPEGVTIDKQGDVLVLTLGEARGRLLTAASRAALLLALEGRVGSARAVVLAAQGRGFAAGLPIEQDEAAPDLDAVCTAVADCPVPVVAVLHGLTLGPGAELALAAHARLAASDVRIAFAEVALGLPPGGGAAVRLPALIGAEAALDLLLSGRVVRAEEAVRIGLVDGVMEGAPLSAAVRLAAAMAGGRGPKRVAPDPRAWHQAVAAARRDPSARRPVGQRIVDCVEAALLLPAANALAFAAVAREDLETAPETQALRAAARAERRAVQLPADLAQAVPAPVRSIGLVGQDPGLALLATAALREGLEVIWSQTGGPAAWARIRAGVEAGLSPQARPAGEAMARLVQGSPDREPEADLVIAGPDGAGTPGSALRLVLGGAADGIGLSLAPSGRLAELAWRAADPVGAVVTAHAALRRIGILPLLLHDRPVLSDRVTGAGDRALAWMAAQGVPRRALAAALDGYAPTLPDSGGSIPLREMRADEIRARWLGAMANAGLRLMEEGILRQASDLDLCLILGHGFPRDRGGPMHWADGRGAMLLRRDLRDWAGDDPVWSPAPLLDALIRDGRRILGPVG